MKYLLYYVKIFQQITFCFGVPEIVVFAADFGESGKEFVIFAEFCKVVDAGERHSYSGVDHLFASGDRGQIQHGGDNCIKSADVGDHYFGVYAVG